MAPARIVPDWTMPSAFVFGGMWFADKLAHSEEARREHLAMRRAIVLETLSSEVLKVAFRRERPGPGVSRNGWGDGGLSFPSGHTTAAFAFASAVDAEWGRLSPGRPRWVASALYGIAALTGISRVFHDRHWTSDVVMGGAIGYLTGRAIARWHADARQAP